jgi:pimeloyl-ACP methyl ester carboxylesterase
MTSTRRALAGALLSALVLTAVACGDDDVATPPRPTDRGPIPANGTTLHVTRHGEGDPLLLVHGGGEDAAMLEPQAASLGAAGYDVITYDRRGTGRSGHEDWPGAGATQHADDAAALLDALGVGPAIVVGVSSGGVIALELAARHPGSVTRTIAWEPPAAGVVPGGDVMTAEIMAPIEAHLTAHPDDFVGAQAILLSAVLGFPVTVDDPAFATARENAEPFIRDEPTITLADLDLAALADQDVTIAVGDGPNDLVAAAAGVLVAALGEPAVTVTADHEVYLSDPGTLTGIVTGSAAR